jgi:hypothetical protein
MRMVDMKQIDKAVVLPRLFSIHLPDVAMPDDLFVYAEDQVQ